MWAASSSVTELKLTERGYLLLSPFERFVIIKYDKSPEQGLLSLLCF